MTINYDNDETCDQCGVRTIDHGDVCDPRALDVAGEEARAERVRDMDRDDWEANSD